MAGKRRVSGGGRLRERAVPRRRRRTPEQAREEILDAAERVFARARPDEVGLLRVARAAGISHALITHYFGTYAGLVAETLGRRVRRLRERILGELHQVGSMHRPGELLGMLFAALEDPVHLRLVQWRVANGMQSGALALEDRGIALVAQEIAAALDPRPEHGGAKTLETIQLALVAVVAAAFGYAMMKAPLAAAIGRTADVGLSQHLPRTITQMLASYLHTELGLELGV